MAERENKLHWGMVRTDLFYWDCLYLDINWKVKPASWLVASKLSISYSCGIKHCWSCFLLVEDNSRRIIVVMYSERKTRWSFRKSFSRCSNGESGNGIRPSMPEVIFWTRVQLLKSLFSANWIWIFHFSGIFELLLVAFVICGSTYSLEK